MSKQLKSCPFCGEEPKERFTGNTYTIQCEGAFCGMASVHGPSFDVESTKQGWNNRQPMQDCSEEMYDLLVQATSIVKCLDDLSHTSKSMFCEEAMRTLAKARGESC